jgi:hypothetical protein
MSAKNLQGIASSQAPRNDEGVNSTIKISINNENGIWFCGAYIKNVEKCLFKIFKKSIF